MERKCSFHSVLFMMICLLMVTYCMAIKQTNIDTDQSALLSLKNHITSDPHHILSKNWSSTAPSSSVCGWIGVRCDSLHRRVSSLNISGMDLTGTIPPHLGNLSFLIYLDMRNNYFHGTLPQELSKLRRIRYIRLGYNNLTGNIPTWFAPNLQVFSLHVNDFSGIIPSSISNMSNLEVLDFEINSLSGKIPQEIANLSRLTILNLQTNFLVGSIPSSILNISSLQNVALTENYLTGSLPVDICHSLPNLIGIYFSFNQLNGQIPPSLSHCSRLEMMSLSYNNFSGFIPNELGNLRMLQHLRLGVNNLRGSIPKEIGNLTKLIDLHLSYNFLHGAIPEELSKLEAIERLFLATNQLTSDPTSLELDFLTSLTRCKSLHDLQLDGNPLNGILPKSIGNLSTSLQYFQLGFTEIRGHIPSEIGNLSSAILISLEDNQLTGAIPNSFQELKNLQGLSFTRNKIGGTLDTLCNIQSLDQLLLGENQLLGPIPECFGNMSLRKILMNNNLLTSTIPISFWNLNDLMVLDLSSNTLKGSLPVEIANLKAMISMDLSGNQLSGMIPTTLGGLQNLQNISFANNLLEGSIPESFGKMLSLTSLNLSHNNLSGLIPKSLEALHSLQVFDVSFNHLSGKIPSGGPFTSFTNESFIFNDGLCGDVKFKVPPCRNSSLNNRRKRKLLLIVCIPLGFTALISSALALLLKKYWKKSEASGKNSSLIQVIQERISYYELLQATNGFGQNNLLGSGSFGSVYKGILGDGRFIAVKVFNSQVIETFKSFNIECEIFKNVRHRNIVKVISSCSNHDFNALVLQYMNNNSLETWLHSHDHFLNITQRLNIMIDVASALYYLHHEYTTLVIHCDLKPSNVLLDEDMVAHVSDFGVAKMLSKEESTVLTKTIATIGYIAPEYGSEGLISRKCDVYSYGIMLMEVFTKKRPNDEMFSGDLNLKAWVNNAMTDSILGIIDADLLTPSDEHFTEKLECISSIMELALISVCESPKDRCSMAEVLSSLNKIKLKLLQYHGIR